MSTLSVIIPTWCEAPRIARAVSSALRFADEVIVADARSPDGTAAIARAHGAQVVLAPKGRGAQLRAGADAARGSVLVFLHADAELGPGAREAIFRALAHPAVLGGNFLLRFEGRSAVARLFTLANDWRRRLFAIYYGDSALFVRREVYDAIGGFKPYPIFEDHDFVRRLERRRPGRTAYIRDVTVMVSARRFEDAPLRTLFGWTVLHTLYSLANVPPDKLVALYADIREHTRAAWTAGG